MDKREPNLSAAKIVREAARPQTPDRFSDFSLLGEPTCGQCRKPMRIERRQGLRRVYRCSACGLLDKTPM